VSEISRAAVRFADSFGGPLSRARFVAPRPVDPANLYDGPSLADAEIPAIGPEVEGSSSCPPEARSDS